MDWKNQIQQQQANRRNLLSIFESYNKAIKTVGRNLEGIRWLYHASQSANSTMSPRWERFCANIRTIYQRYCRSNSNDHSQDQSHSKEQHRSKEQHHSSEDNQTRNREQEEKLRARIQKLQKSLKEREDKIKELELSVQKKTREVRILRKKSLDKQMIKLLIKLCHPDKNKHERADEVTRLLFGLLHM